MKKWYCLINGQTFGPYSKDQLKVKAEKGTITPDTLVRTGLEKGGRNWIRVGETEINDIFSKYTSASGDSRKTVNSEQYEEENKDDVKNTILKILQILHTIFIESEHRGFYILFGLLGFMMLTALLAQNMVLAVVVIVLFFLYRTTAMVLRHRRLKRQQDIDILNADINKISDDEAARRAEKYQNR
jgi:uncharacterized membrane protein